MSEIIPNQNEELEKIKDHLRVETSNGELICFLSPGMALKQKLTAEDLDKIKSLHIELYDLFEKMQKSKSKKKYRLFAQEVEKIEYKLQESWKFPRDSSKHIWWYKVPHCQCPKMDNADSWGTDQRIINEQCPVHAN